MTGQSLASDTFAVFGTTAVLLVTQPAALGTARAIADVELAGVDAACNRFRPDSELSILNNARGELVSVSELFATLIAEALRAAELTDGAVDPTCGAALLAAGYDRDFAELRSAPAIPDQGRGGQPAPDRGDREPGQADQPALDRGDREPGQAGQPAPGRGDAEPGQGGWPVPGWRGVEFDRHSRQIRLADGVRLDLGATAKAWAADHCAALIAARADCGVLVSLGGDIAVAGPPPADGWQVKVTDDHAAADDAPGQTVTIRSGGLATSSTTVRAWTKAARPMHHIIDPATGEPAASPWRTVSVAAASCADANIASTAAIIKGAAAPGWLSAAGLPARLVGGDGTVRTTVGWPTG